MSEDGAEWSQHTNNAYLAVEPRELLIFTNAVDADGTPATTSWTPDGQPVSFRRSGATGKGTVEDIDTLLDTCDNILGRSFCALGDGATSPITSAVKYFREEFVAGTHTPAWELFPYRRSTLFAEHTTTEPAGMA